MSTEDRLAQAEIDKQDMVAEIDGTILRLKAKLAEETAEAAKPKLRHGDYRTNPPWHDPLIYLDGDWFNKKDKMHNGTAWCEKHGEYSGNIFDDLAALQEDVTEFEIAETEDDWAIRVDIDDEDEQVQFRVVYSSGVEDREQGMGFPFSQLPAVILGLKKFEATLNRRASK
jgi:hypothetical protein